MNEHNGVSFSDEYGDKLGNKAYRLQITDDDEDDISVSKLCRRLHIADEQHYTSEYDSAGFTDSDDDRLSHTQTPPPDDTKRKYMPCYFFDSLDNI